MTRQIRKLFDNPHEVTRDELLELADRYWPAGSGPLHTMSVIVGLLQDVAELRGFEPFDATDVMEYREAHREERREAQRLREEQLRAEENERNQKWIEDSLVRLRDLIETRGVYHALKKVSRIAKSAPQINWFSRSPVTDFKAQAEKMLEEYSRQQVTQ